ncbi:MAG: 2-keto-4-pentenoate hydratase [Gammaproteobacteria bacterium]
MDPSHHQVAPPTADAQSALQPVADALVAAYRARTLYTPPSASHPLDLDQAYDLQRRFVAGRAVEDPIAGFKAGLHAPAAQRALGLAGPGCGVLFVSGRHTSGATVRRDAYRGLVLESELGFRTACAITAPVAGEPALRSVIATVAPMFELADSGFGKVALRGVDLIGTNLAGGGYVEGAPTPIDQVDLNAITLALDHDGHRRHEARADDLFGDHWLALEWLIHAALARHGVIPAGSLLLTGSLGPAHAAEPGLWATQYAGLGAIEVLIV